MKRYRHILFNIKRANAKGDSQMIEHLCNMLDDELGMIDTRLELFREQM